MKTRRDGWNIVLAGFWNRSIFLPEWVGHRLFRGETKPAQVALTPGVQLIYDDEFVVLEVSGTRIVIRPKLLNNNDGLLRAEGLARDVLRALPETPVVAVGVNFGFAEMIPSPHVVAILADADDSELAQQGWTIKERKLTRHLTRQADALNLSMTYSSEAVNIDFNFVTEAGTNAAAMLAVAENRSLSLRDAAFHILRNVYHLELEDDDVSNAP